MYAQVCHYIFIVVPNGKCWYPKSNVERKFSRKLWRISQKFCILDQKVGVHIGVECLLMRSLCNINTSRTSCVDWSIIWWIFVELVRCAMFFIHTFSRIHILGRHWVVISHRMVTGHGLRVVVHGTGWRIVHAVPIWADRGSSLGWLALEGDGIIHSHGVGLVDGWRNSQFLLLQSLFVLPTNILYNKRIVLMKSTDFKVWIHRKSANLGKES